MINPYLNNMAQFNQNSEIMNSVLLESYKHNDENKPHND
jgi:hypothetical protein